MSDQLTRPVVDAHHHLCHYNDGYSWLCGPPVPRYHGDDTVLRKDYLLKDYRADCTGVNVVASVCVENGADDPMREATWIEDVLGGGPDVQVAKADLLDADAPRLLDGYAAMSTVRGIRDILNWHPDPYYSHRDRNGIMDDPAWRKCFARLAPLSLSFDLQVFPNQLDDAARLAADFPDTRIVLDHAGMPIRRDDTYLEAWGAGLRRLAEHDNVCVKLSAWGTTDHQWTVDSIRGPILTAIEAFGVDRSMFASNFPVDSMYSNMATLYSAFEMVVDDFSPRDKNRLFAATAADFYRMERISGQIAPIA